MSSESSTGTPSFQKLVGYTCGAIAHSIGTLGQSSLNEKEVVYGLVAVLILATAEMLVRIGERRLNLTIGFTLEKGFERREK